MNSYRLFLSVLFFVFLSHLTTAQSGNEKLTKDVFGFLVDWEYLEGNHQYIQYDLLTHLACFPFKTDSLGDINAPDPATANIDSKGYPFLWPWNDVIDSAKANNVKLLMSVIETDTNKISTVFNDESVRTNFIQNVAALVIEYEFDGVNIDFEPIGYNDRAAPIQNFLRELTDSIKAINPLHEVSFSSPIKNWGNWDFDALAQSCDYLFVMGYNFHGSWSAPGPTAPIKAQYLSLNLSLSQEDEYGPAVSNNPDKLILGIPYFGDYWQTATELHTNTDYKYIEPVMFRDLETYSNDMEDLFSNVFNTSWYRWESDTTWNQIWIDNKESLARKYDLVIQKNLKGVGLWALGFDGAKTDYWELIDEKIGAGATSIEDVNELPTEFVLKQNYPNPFNPSTRIEFFLPEAGNVRLEIFDILGRRVAELVNRQLSTGLNSVEWNGKDDLGREVSSGMYIYQVRYGTTVLSKKMMLLK